MKKSRELEENFDKFKVNRVDRERARQYNKSEYRDSILVTHVPLKNLTKDYEKFDGLPGVDSHESDLDEFYKLQGEGSQDKILKAKLFEERTYKHWLSLISCSVLSSSLSPLMICMKESVAYKLFWMFILVFMISTFQLFRMKKGKFHDDSYNRYLDKDMFRNLFLPSLCFICWIFCIVYSCHYDNTSHSLVFANTHTFMIAIYGIVRGEKASMKEIAGLGISLLGLLIIAYDDNTFSYRNSIYNMRNITNMEKLLKGNMVGFIGSVFAAIFFVRMKKQMSQYHIFEKLYVTSLTGMSLFLLISIFEHDTSIDQHLIYSFLNFRTFFLISLVACLSITLSNYLLYTLNDVFNRMTVSIAMQLQPLFASILVFVLGEQGLPGFRTLIGMLCCIPGLILLKNEQKMKETDDFISCSRSSGSVLPSFQSPTTKAREMVLF